MHVAILGAGLAGLTTAYTLNRRGVAVTVVDRREGPGLETSFANAALMHPSLVDPWNSPGVGWDLLRWLGRDDAPMLLHLKHLPSLSFWGLRFLAESIPSRHRINTLKNLRLALLARREMAALRQDIDLSFCWKKTGVLSISRSAAAFAASRDAARALEPFGVSFRIFDRDETIAAEPALAAVAMQIRGSVYFTDDERGDAYQFCAALTRALQARGVKFHFNCTISGIATQPGRVTAIQTSAGDFTADKYVLAAGSYSTPLADALGLRLPVRPAKGYSATLRCRGNPHAPAMPISDNGVHAAVTPLDDERVRIAGTAEFAGLDTTIRQPRIDYLMALLQKIYPRLAESVRPEDITPWAGLRPMSADGVPTVSRTMFSNLVLNTGHGHIGWTTAMGTARLAADIICEKPAELDIADYSLNRF
jgi:D-amino-acid dehydrogenase